MVQAYFDNIEEKLSAHIAKAGRRIYVAVAWFTNEALFGGLLNALQKSVEVKVLLLDDILNRNEFGLDYGVLVNKGADVRFATSNKRTMHNKFCVIDNKVITGSYNWTYHANVNNENIVITDELNIVNSYCEQFETLFNVCDPIKLPYEHLKWTEVKEEDFTELRGNIYRDVKAQNDVNSALRQKKLKCLNDAYKSGSAEELAKAGSLPIEELRTIMDVLTSRYQNYAFKLWEENTVGHPCEGISYLYWRKWFYIPHEIKEDKYHREYIQGKLKCVDSMDYGRDTGNNLEVDDELFLKTIKAYWSTYEEYELIPEQLLIEHAKMFYYQFPSPMYNKSQPRTRPNSMPRTIQGINVLGIAKEVDGDKVVFYEGWDPQKRGEKIMKEFFVKA